MARKLQEILADRLLLLWLLYDAMNYKRFGETKVQKLVFLSEWKMIDNLEKGFNYNFIRLSFGAFSPDVEKDVKWLEDEQLIEAIPISEKARIFRQTRFGNKLFNDFREIFRRNVTFTRRMAEINRKYAKKPLQELVDYVYSLPHPYIKGLTILKSKFGQPLLYKLDEEKAKEAFKITPEELATLDIYFDDESYRSVIQAFESAKRKPLLKLEEVF